MARLYRCGARRISALRLASALALHRNERHYFFALLRLGHRSVEAADHRHAGLGRQLVERDLDDLPIARRKGYSDYLVRHSRPRYNAETGGCRNTAPAPDQANLDERSTWLNQISQTLNRVSRCLSRSRLIR